MAGSLILTGRLFLSRRFAALGAGVAFRLPRLGPARVGFTAIVSRIVAAWTSIAARIPRTVAPNVAIAVAIPTVAVSIAIAAAAAIAIVADVAMLRPVALRLCRCSRCLGRRARRRIAKQPVPESD